jgi:hypothetical protein
MRPLISQREVIKKLRNTPQRIDSTFLLMCLLAKYKTVILLTLRGMKLMIWSKCLTIRSFIRDLPSNNHKL